MKSNSWTGTYRNVIGSDSGGGTQIGASTDGMGKSKKRGSYIPPPPPGGGAQGLIFNVTANSQYFALISVGGM